MKRHEALAGDLDRRIRSEELRPGDRVPSVRSLFSPRRIFGYFIRLNTGHSRTAASEHATARLAGILKRVPRKRFNASPANVGSSPGQGSRDDRDA